MLKNLEQGLALSKIQMFTTIIHSHFIGEQTKAY